MVTQKRINSFDRLSTLPAIFTGRDLTVRFGWSNKTASHYIWLWSKQGRIDKLGGHSDTFANLVVEKTPNWEAALLRALPSATKIGVECLRIHGWTTQIQTIPDAAIDASGSEFSIDKFIIHKRPVDWFDTVSKGIDRPHAQVLPLLRPAWALADLVSQKQKDAHSWLIAPDDIEFDAITTRDQKDWLLASKSLNIGQHALTEEGYSELFDSLTSERTRPAMR